MQNSVGRTDTAFTGRQAEITASDFAEFVGHRADHYVPLFQNFSGPEETRFAFSWNWPAFVFGSFWLSYRKLYGWAFVTFLPIVLPTRSIGPLIHLGLGMTANYLYCRHAEKKIRTTKMTDRSPDWRAQVAKKGGVNVRIIPVLAILIGGLSIAQWLFHLGLFGPAE